MKAAGWEALFVLVLVLCQNNDRIIQVRHNQRLSTRTITNYPRSVRMHWNWISPGNGLETKQQQRVLRNNREEQIVTLSEGKDNPYCDLDRFNIDMCSRFFMKLLWWSAAQHKTRAEYPLRQGSSRVSLPLWMEVVSIHCIRTCMHACIRGLQGKWVTASQVFVCLLEVLIWWWRPWRPKVPSGATFLYLNDMRD